MNRFLIVLAATAAFILPTAALAEKRFQRLGFSFIYADGDKHDTAGSNSVTAFRLRDTDTIAFFGLRNALYGPADITKRQGVDEPLYAGYNGLVLGIQRPYKNYTWAVWAGFDHTNGSMEWVQKKWHELRNIDTKPSDDLNREASGWHSVIGGEVRRQFVLGKRGHLCVTPYVMAELGYVSTATVGVDAVWGVCGLTVGRRDLVTTSPMTIPDRKGWSLQGGLSVTAQDAPYLAPTNANSVYATAYAGVQYNWNTVSLGAGVAYKTERFQQQDGGEPIIYYRAVWKF